MWLKLTLPGESIGEHDSPISDQRKQSLFALVAMTFASWPTGRCRISAQKHDSQTQRAVITQRYGGSFYVSSEGDGRQKNIASLQNLLVGSAIRVLVGSSQQTVESIRNGAVTDLPTLDGSFFVHVDG